ncbi:MAG TPA: hypothetical protein VK184_07470 [Nostocaceae cyanobacterium]|nr:hypothetical protein [Nostocaceae cyanobacterium]
MVTTSIDQPELWLTVFQKRLLDLQIWQIEAGAKTPGICQNLRTSTSQGIEMTLRNILGMSWRLGLSF